MPLIVTDLPQFLASSLPCVPFSDCFFGSIARDPAFRQTFLRILGRDRDIGLDSRPQHLTTLLWAMAIARAEAPWCTNVGSFLQILMAGNCQDTFEVAGKATDAIAMQAGC